MKLLLALLVAVPASARPPGHGHADQPRQFLTIEPQAGGTVVGGEGSADVGRVNCGTGGKACYFDFRFGSKVYLSWVPDEAGTVNTWNGACSDAGEVCVVTMTKARSAAAFPAARGVSFKEAGAALRAFSSTAGRIEAWRQYDKVTGTMTEENKVLDCGGFPTRYEKCAAKTERNISLWARRGAPAVGKIEDIGWAGSCATAQRAVECRTTVDQYGALNTFNGNAVVVTVPEGGSVSYRRTSNEVYTCSSHDPGLCVVMFEDYYKAPIWLNAEGPAGTVAKWTGAPNCPVGNTCKIDYAPVNYAVSVEFVKKP